MYNTANILVPTPYHSHTYDSILDTGQSSARPNNEYLTKHLVWFGLVKSKIGLV